MKNTDLTKFKILIDSFGIEYREEHKNGKTALIFLQGTEKVGGYYGFWTNFIFNSDGSFIGMGCWEGNTEELKFKTKC